MLERTIAISARHMASPEVEKLFITVKCPESLLPSHRQLVQFLEMNIRKWVRTEGIRDYGQEEYDGPAPDNHSIEAEKAERDAAREELVQKERAANREANKLPDRDPPRPKPKVTTIDSVPAIEKKPALTKKK